MEDKGGFQEFRRPRMTRKKLNDTYSGQIWFIQVGPIGSLELMKKMFEKKGILDISKTYDYNGIVLEQKTVGRKEGKIIKKANYQTP